MSLKNNLYTINSEIVSLYKKRDINSEMISQALYGENFYVLKEHNKWIFIKLKDDNYKGWVLNCNIIKILKIHIIVNSLALGSTLVQI